MACIQRIMNSTCLFILMFSYWTIFRFHCIIWTNPKWRRLCVCVCVLKRLKEKESASPHLSLSLDFLEIWIKFELHEYFSHTNTHNYTNHHFIWNAPWAYARVSKLSVTQVAIWYTKQYTKYTCALTVSNNFDWNVNCVCAVQREVRLAFY